MNRLPAHECPGRPVQSHIPYREAVQEQGDPWWSSVPVSRGASPHVASKAAVRAAVWSWGLGDTTVDPGEVLLRLVTQSAARAERYAMLLEEAYEAAERLKQAHDAGAQIEAPGDELADTAETARRDLDRIFNTGGVAALVGNTCGAAKDVGKWDVRSASAFAFQTFADLLDPPRTRTSVIRSVGPRPSSESSGGLVSTAWRSR